MAENNLVQKVFRMADEMATKKGITVSQVHLYDFKTQELFVHITYVPTPVSSIADVTVDKHNVAVEFLPNSGEYNIVNKNSERLDMIVDKLQRHYETLGLTPIDKL